MEHHVERTLTATASVQRGETYGSIPRLAVPVQDELVLLEPQMLGELADVSLSGAPADLPGVVMQDDARPYLIDVERGQVQAGVASGQSTLDLNRGASVVSREQVIRELSRLVRRDDVLPPDLVAWLGRALNELAARGIELAYVARHLNQTAVVVASRIESWVAQRQRSAFQACLLPGSPSTATLSDRHAFEFDPNVYPASWFYGGRWQFTKHFYPRPGELQDDPNAEETACAIDLDRLDEVRFWVRNLERQARTSFWLPTSTDRFYPDFVARLKDGRLFVVEYKGSDRYTNADSIEKRDIGRVWASASGGRCIFATVSDAVTIGGGSVTAQLRRALQLP